MGKHKKKKKSSEPYATVLAEAKEAAAVQQYWPTTGESKRREPSKHYKYIDELAYLQFELIKLQEWVRLNGLKVCVLFEGRDAAGKGGAIKRISEPLNPRICRIVPPPCRRCPSGRLQGRSENLPSSSSASNALQMRACRSPKNATALPDRSLASLMHVIDQARDGLRIGVGPDPVAEVDDVPRRLAGFLEERIDLALQILE